jgi:3-phosphoshikimate 1-carboxyvinyltransferase
VHIRSEGWRPQGDTLLVPSDKSSQFLSGVVLSAWGLPFDLFVSPRPSKNLPSESYWQMTRRMVARAGMALQFWDHDFRIPKDSEILVDSMDMEPDVGSMFVVAALAAVSGSATLLDVPTDGLQPDIGFIRILETMGVPVERTAQTLKVHRAANLQGVAVNLRQMPDLFPVLAALAGLANGPSDLYGAPQLVHKESNRLARMTDLLQMLGRKVEPREDGLKILGPCPSSSSWSPFEVNVEEDHRLAFAMAVWKAAGVPVTIRGGDSVNKSFPEFWSLLS